MPDAPRHCMVGWNANDSRRLCEAVLGASSAAPAIAGDIVSSCCGLSPTAVIKFGKHHDRIRRVENTKMQYKR